MNTQTAGFQFEKEKQFQKYLINHLRTEGWITYTEKPQGKNRPDIIIYREDIDAYIGVELKHTDSSYNMTTALKQIMRYQKNPMSPQPELWAVGVPNWSEENWRSKRFFWRFGIGIIELKTNEIIFINGGKNIDHLCLDHLNTVFHWRKNTKEQIEYLKEKTKEQTIWNVN